MSAMQMSAIESAIVAWVRTGSGLAIGKVIWAAQNSPAPESPYIALRMRAIRPLGSDWLDVEDNPTPTPGAEVLLKLRGMRRVTLGITCYGATGTGGTGPLAIVTDVLAALGLPSVSAALVAASVGVSSIADVLAVDGVVNSTLLEPRATVDVQFYATSELVEACTYIEHVEIENEAADPDEFFTVEP